MSAHLAREHGRELLARLQEVDDMAEEELKPFPRWRGNGAGRPTPEEEALANRLRDLRTLKAKELGLDRGVLLSNAQITDIVRSDPRSLKGLRAIPGIRRWQVEILGTEVLRLLKKR
jgi:ribonuclease D